MKRDSFPAPGSSLPVVDLAQTFPKTPALISFYTRCGKPSCRCRQGALRIAIDEYRTDGSGVGTVRVATGERTLQTQVLEVERTGLEWRVLDTVPAAQ